MALHSPSGGTWSPISRNAARRLDRQARRFFFETLEDRRLLATVLTDKLDYAPAETALITASDFERGESVKFQVLHIDGTPNTGNGHEPWTVTDGGTGDLDGKRDGNISTTWFVDPDDSLGATFELSALGLSSGLFDTHIFTDAGPPSVDQLYQWDPPGWVTGNNDGPYFEGDTVPYYTSLSNLVVGTTYQLTIEWDTTKSGKHALDYIGTFDASVTPIDPAVEAGINVVTTDTIAIPLDPNITADPSFVGTQAPGVLTIYNGDLIAMSGYTLTGTYAGDSSTSIVVTFVAQDDNVGDASTSVVLTWGGHIATRQDWGPDSSAVSIPGSPYHMRLQGFFDVTNNESLNVGNTDRSLSADAVIFPAIITIIKDAVPDSAQDFAFTTTGTGLSNFTLDDDGTNANPLSNQIVFNVTDFGTKTITEALVAGWDLTAIEITEEGATADSTFSLANRLATLQVQEGETITVRFTNTAQSSITVVKDAIPNGPQDFSFSGTLGAFALDDDADPTLPSSQLFGNLTPGSYTITEAALAGWDLTNLVLSGDTDNGSVINVAGRTVTIDLDPGETISATFTNTQRGNITVVKDAIPNGPQDFSFSGTLGAFSLDDDADPTLPSSQLFSNLTSGSYTVTEAALAGWDLTNLVLSGDTDGGSVINVAGRTVTIDLDPGETITATFTNTQRGNITVVKDAIPNGPQDFSFSGTLGAFSLDDDADPTLPSNQLFGNLVPGSYTVTEAALAGWDLTNLVLSGDTDNGSVINVAGRTVTIDLDPGETITATFTNTQRGNITVVKDAIPNGPQDFSFSGTLGAFALDDDADPTLPSSQLFGNLTPGSYTITEAALAGWDLTNLVLAGDTDGGSVINVAGRTVTIDLDPGETITATFTNTARGGITVVKDAIPNGPQDFTFSGTLGAFLLDDDADPTLPNSVNFGNLAPGSYTVTEAALAGWDLTNLVLSGDTDGGSVINVAGRTVTIDLDAGETITATFTNTQRGSVTVVKDAIPNGPQDFSFSGSFGAFLLDDDADPTLPNSQLFGNLTPGSYTVTESALAGWDLTNLVLSGDTDGGSVINVAGRTVTIDLDPGETITATFTNTARGGITVVKDAIPNGPQDFSFSGTLGAFLLDDDADPTLPNSQLFGNLVPGSYTVTEAALAGWDLTNLVLSGDTDNGSVINVAGRTVTIDLDPGETITATFTNTQRGNITVVKDAIPNGPQDFSFSGTLGAFLLDDDADPALPSSQLFGNLTPGSYTVTEAALAGWDLTNLVLSGDTDGGSVINVAGRTVTIDLDPGETITATFTNTSRGGITVVKDAIPNSPQDFSFSGTLGGFQLDDDADPTLPSSQFFGNLTPGSYAVTEAALAGWDLTNLVLSGDTDNGSVINVAGRTVTIDLDAGETITATFTNTQRGSITVVKDAIPNGPQDFSFSGTLGAFQLDDDADPTLPNSQLFGNLVPGSYTVTEAALAGWDLTNLVLAGDTDGGSVINVAARTVTIDLDPGETITATFTNTGRGTITVVKDAVPNGPQDFTFSGTLGNFLLDDDADPTLPNSQQFANLLAGSYTVTEAALAGWDLTNLVLAGDADNGSVIDQANRTVTIDLDPGETITATFTNTQRGSIAWEKRDEQNLLQGGATFVVSPNPTDGAGTLTVLDNGPNDANPVAGQFLVVNVLPGTYVVTETVPPPNYTIDDDADRIVTVSSGDLNAVIGVQGQDDPGNTDESDFHNIPILGTKAGTKFEDHNGNGIRDLADQGLSGWTIFVDYNSDGHLTAGEPSAVTDANGDYTILNINVGTWRIREVLQPGWTATFPAAADAFGRYHEETFVPGSVFTGNDFGNFQNFSISGQKFGDVNQNGIKELNEPRLPGWTIQLDIDADGIVDATTVTDAGGNYSFTNLGPGIYRVREALQPGWTQTTVNPADIVGASGTNVTDIDFGNFRPGIIVIGPDKSPMVPAPVLVLDQATGDVKTSFLAYEANFVGGTRVTTGDVTGDGIDEIITAPGRGRAGEVRVFTQDGVELTAFRTMAYPTTFKGGVQVAVGDVNGDGLNDIVTAKSSGAAQIKVFLNQTPNADPIANAAYRTFNAFPTTFVGGAFVRVADMGMKVGTNFVNTLDGKAEIIVGSGPGIKAAIKVFYVNATPAAVRTIYPFTVGTSVYKNGVNFDVARLDGDLIPDLVVGTENGGNSRVETWIWNGSAQLVKTGTFMAFGDSPSKIAPVRVAAIDTNGDGIANQIATVQGPNGTTQQVRIFDIVTINPLVVTQSATLAPLPGPYFIADLGGPAPAQQQAQAEGEAFEPLTLAALASSAAGSMNLDLNGDGAVTASDALLIVNRLNQQASTTTTDSADLAFDVNGDGRLTALDALLIVNELNKTAAAIALAPTGSQSESDEYASDVDKLLTDLAEGSILV
jgi:tRNA A37 threonylcarbamoyltransferase TsaD